MEFKINEILARLKIPGLEESHTRHTIAELLTSTIGVPITPKQITKKETNLFLNVPPIIKSAITLHKTEILKKLEDQKIHITTIL